MAEAEHISQLFSANKTTKACKNPNSRKRIQEENLKHVMGPGHNLNLEWCYYMLGPPASLEKVGVQVDDCTFYGVSKIIQKSAYSHLDLSMYYN